MRYFAFLILFLCLSNARLLASETPPSVADPKAVGEPTFSLTESTLEIGGSLGTPALANLLIGIHFPVSEMSAFVRLSGMFHGTERTSGWETDLGIYFDRNLPFQQSLALSLANHNLYRVTSSTRVRNYTAFIGVAYSFNIRGFFFKGGLATPVGSSLYSNSSDGKIVPIAQAGYTVFIN